MARRFGVGIAVQVAKGELPGLVKALPRDQTLNQARQGREGLTVSQSQPAGLFRQYFGKERVRGLTAAEEGLDRGQFRTRR